MPIRSHIPDPPCCRAVNIETGAVREATRREVEWFETARPQSGLNDAPGMAHMWGLRNFGAPPTIAALDGEPELVKWRRPFANGAAAVLALTDPNLRGRNAPKRLYVRTSQTAPFVPCAAEACAGWIIEAWQASNGDIVFLRREGWAFTTFTFYRWRPSTGDVRPISSTLDIWFECQQASDRLICFTEGSLSPQTMVSLDMRSGEIAQLLDLNPAFPRRQLAPAERLEWRSPAGNPTYAYFVRPQSPMPAGGYPLAIVHYRPRGFLRGGSGDFSPIQAYAAAGIAVLAVDRPEPWDLYAREEDDEEIERINFEDSRLRRDIQAALLGGIDTLVARGNVNPSRIGITGLSDGSASTAFAIIHSTRFRAASISGGAWEPILFAMSSPQQRAFYSRLGIGAPGSADDRHWNDLSIARNAQRITTPLLIQTADSELGMIVEPLVMLQTHGKPVEAYVFPDEYHVPWQPAHRLAMYRRNLDWMRFWLQDYEDRAPEKEEQYRRWRLMRDGLPQPARHS
jgi:dipeptidyl aminopeptidase/acylaminoacyl peptidase